MGKASGCTCESLGKKNKDKRKSGGIKTKSGKDSTSKAVAGTDGKGEGTTVSSMCYQKGRSTDIRTAHNSQKALANKDNGLESGQTPANRKKGKSNLCKDAKHKHAPPYNQKSAHTEARLLDGLGKKGFPTGGTLTLSIDWRPKSKKGKSSPMPCKDCHKLLCAAKACGVDIYLCDDKKNKKKLTKKHCKSYSELEAALQPGAASGALD